MRRYRSRYRRRCAPAKHGKNRWGKPLNWIGAVLVLIGLLLIPFLIGGPILLAGLVLALTGLD